MKFSKGIASVVKPYNTEKRTKEMAELSTNLGENAMRVRFLDRERGVNLCAYVFDRAASGYDLLRWINDNVNTRYMALAVRSKVHKLTTPLPLDWTLTDMLQNRAPDLKEIKVYCETRAAFVKRTVSECIETMPANFPGCIQYSATDRSRMRVVVEMTRGDYIGHPTVYVQPIMDADTLGGRSQPWFAYDVLQHHRIPVLRVRMYAEPRSKDKDFETTKEFSLAQVGQIAARTVQGKFHYFVNNCQKFCLRFLKKLGLAKEARGVYIAAQHGTRGLRSRWYKHRNPFKSRDPSGIDEFMAEEAREFIFGATPPVAQAAHILAYRKTRSMHLGGDFEGFSIFGGSDFPVPQDFSVRQDPVPTKSNKPSLFSRFVDKLRPRPLSEAPTIVSGEAFSAYRRSSLSLIGIPLI